jgi:quinol monooxygenase YgiN
MQRDDSGHCRAIRLDLGATAKIRSSSKHSRHRHFDHRRTKADSRSLQICTERPTDGDDIMNHYATQKSLSDAVDGGGLLVVAQWEAKEGQADRVADILSRFLPEAQREPGAKMFLISRAKENPAQFLFYELFRDEAAFKAHQESEHFKTYIAGEALPLLAKRERMQYALL